MATKKISELTELISPVETDIIPIINTGETKKVKLENLKDVLGITQAETNITNIETNITNIETNITNIEADITNIEADITNIEADITNIEADITTIENVTQYLTATADVNGDYKIDIPTVLATNMFLSIAFPTATTNTQGARISIDNGITYKNIVNLDFYYTPILAKEIENKRVFLYYNGTNWVYKTNLIAAYTFATDGITTGDMVVNLNADGGVYEMYVIGNGSNDTEYKVEYNGITTGYKQIRWYNNGTTIAASSASDAIAGFMYARASTNIHTITMPNGYPQSTQQNTIMNTSNVVEALYYNQCLTTQQTNITSITITKSSGNFATGTKVLIFKK